MKADILFFDDKHAAETPWTKQLWIYDYRTNVHHTLKKKPLCRGDLDAFVAHYKPGALHERVPSWSEDNPDGRWRAYSYEEIVARDKASLDIFWLKDQSLADLDNLPEPDVLAEEIIDNIDAALESFRSAGLQLST